MFINVLITGATAKSAGANRCESFRFARRGRDIEAALQFVHPDEHSRVKKAMAEGLEDGLALFPSGEPEFEWTETSGWNSQHKSDKLFSRIWNGMVMYLSGRSVVA